jgi:hypothetical protein
MENNRRVRKTDLARNTRRVIQDAQRGQVILVEDRGRVVAAILDIVDYYILHAATNHYSHPAEIDPQAGLSSERLAIAKGPQDVYDLVVGHYLADAISLGRAAELLGLPWIDIRDRFNRLDIPVKLGPRDESEVLAEAKAAMRDFRPTAINRGDRLLSDVISEDRD